MSPEREYSRIGVNYRGGDICADSFLPTKRFTRTMKEHGAHGPLTDDLHALCTHHRKRKRHALNVKLVFKPAVRCPDSTHRCDYRRRRDMHACDRPKAAIQKQRGKLSDKHHIRFSEGLTGAFCGSPSEAGGIPRRITVPRLSVRRASRTPLIHVRLCTAPR